MLPRQINYVCHPRSCTRCHSRRWRASLAIGCFAATLTGIAEAQSLDEAMVAAYRNNPALQSQRFRTRASDEAVARARSGYRPKVTGEAYGGIAADRREGPAGRGQGATYGVGLRVEQPLFDGFQTHYAVGEAKEGVLASRNDLAALENETLLATASAYLDVLRDEGVLLYRRQTLNALRREVIGAKQRLEHGDATVTDIEQSRQRAALAEADLEQAAGRLDVSRLRFARIVGVAPAGLAMPDLPERHLPTTRAKATELALRFSPIIAAARHQHAAAQQAVGRIRGELLPSATLSGGYDRSIDDRARGDSEDSFSLVGRLRVPLYQGGAVSARVREARHIAASRDRDAVDQRQRIGEAVGAAWAEFAAAKKRQALEGKAIAAAERALKGVREEQRHGSRTLIDVLDAERELVNARIRVLDTRRDLHVSAYALLRAIGKLTLETVAPNAPRYEPREHYAQAAAKWWGTETPETASDAMLGQDQRREERLQAPRNWLTTVRPN